MAANDIEAQLEQAISNEQGCGEKTGTPRQRTPSKESALSTSTTVGIHSCKPGLFHQVTDSAKKDRNESRPERIRTLKTCPRGYPEVAAFLDSDENFMICRRFGYLHWRVLLEKQRELQYLETNLGELDEEESKARDGSLRGAEHVISALNGEPENERIGLMQDIKKGLLEYKEIVLSAKELAGTARPSNSEYTSFRNFFSNESRLFGDDQEWIQFKQDLITFRPGREYSWLDRSLENLLRISRINFLQKLFRSREDIEKSSETEIYCTRRRIEYATNVIITITILSLLIAPIYVLYHLTNGAVIDGHTTAICIGTLLIFTLAFSAVALFFTRAKRHEVLAAAATYCAVLVVFFGNIPVLQGVPKAATR